MTKDETFAGVCECLKATLNLRDKNIRLEDRIIGDLGADSLELLDLTFHLEQKFGITVNPRAFENRSREMLGDKPLEVDGVYTAAALALLRQSMPEVPSEELSEGLTQLYLPRCFRVATMVNLVDRLLEEKKNE